MRSATAIKALLGPITSLAVALGGCAAGPNYHTPKPDTPSAFVASAPAGPEEPLPCASAAPAGAAAMAMLNAKIPRKLRITTSQSSMAQLSCRLCVPTVAQ